MILQATSDCNDEIHQEIITEGASLAILKCDDITECGNLNMVMAFTVGDVDVEFRRLKDIDIDMIDPPTLRPWGAKNMRFAVPDGNIIVFRSFPNK